MDIKVAVTRVGVFVVVYSLVLGIPFGLAIFGKPWLKSVLGQNWYFAPMTALLILATAGPFIFLYFQRRAENALLQEERNIQDLLSGASIGMRSMRNLPRLLELMVDILAKSLRLDNAAIYLHEPENDQYVLKASRVKADNHVTIEARDPLIKRLEDHKHPIIFEEFKLLAESQHNNAAMHEIVQQMTALKASVIIPIVVEDILLGFAILGERKDRRVYSKELINVLAVLGDQAALAIGNCNYMEAESKRMEEEGMRERRASLDHVASSMAHEIDNPMTVINGQIETLQMSLADPRVTMPPDLRERVDKSMEYVLDARSRVSAMIRAIQEYSRKTTGGLKPLKIYDVEESYWKLIGHAFRKEIKVVYTKDIAENLPYILGDKIQLEEVLINFANNALHAVRYKDIKKIHLKIFRKDDDWIRIEYSDSGYGIEPKIIKDIFLAHVTTKGSVEGTGIGLFRVRKIIELHQGKVWAESEGKDKGAMMVVELPIFKGDVEAYWAKEKADEGPKRMF